MVVGPKKGHKPSSSHWIWRVLPSAPGSAGSLGPQPVGLMSGLTTLRRTSCRHWSKAAASLRSSGSSQGPRRLLVTDGAGDSISERPSSGWETAVAQGRAARQYISITVHPRPHPCCRSGCSASPCVGAPCRRREQRGVQSGDRRGPFRARGVRCLSEGVRNGDPGDGGSSSSRRSAASRG